MPFSNEIMDRITSASNRVTFAMGDLFGLSGIMRKQGMEQEAREVEKIESKLGEADTELVELYEKLKRSAPRKSLPF